MQAVANSVTDLDELWLEQGLATPTRDGIEFMERLLWAGGRQIRSAREAGHTPPDATEWFSVWLRLLGRYEQACTGTFSRGSRAARRSSHQLSLLTCGTAIDAGTAPLQSAATGGG